MSNLAFALIVTSSIAHALYNMLVKRSRHKTVFIWWMFIVSSVLFTAGLPWVPEHFRWPDGPTACMIAGGAFCFVLYHLLLARAYQGGDLSVIYPLAQTSMVYVPVWGVVLLKEHFSPLGICGIFLVIFGTYSLQMQRIALTELVRPFQDLRLGSVQAALGAGFIYSIGSVTEKTGVGHYSPLFFTYFLVVSMLALMSLNMSRPKYRDQIGRELRENWRHILCSGPIIMVSFLTYRYGLNLAQVGYAVPVRQVSIVVGVLIGILFLRESFGRIRLTSSLFILAGAFLIRLG